MFLSLTRTCTHIFMQSFSYTRNVAVTLVNITLPWLTNKQTTIQWNVWSHGGITNYSILSILFCKPPLVLCIFCLKYLLTVSIVKLSIKWTSGIWRLLCKKSVYTCSFLGQFLFFTGSSYFLAGWLVWHEKHCCVIVFIDLHFIVKK